MNKELDALEQQRLEIVKRYSYPKLFGVLAGIVLLFTATMLIVVSSSPGKTFLDYIYWLFLPIVLCTWSYVLFRMVREKKFKPLESEYQSKVLAKISKFIDPDSKYSPNSGISEEVFKKTGLFPLTKTYLVSNGVDGKAGESEYSVSSVKYFETYKTKDKNGRESTREHVIFRGVYCIIKINTGIKDSISIKKIIDTLLYTTTTSHTGQKPIPSGNSEFDSIYKLYCDSDVEAKKFIDSKGFSRLLSFKKKQEGDVEYYLNGNELHVAMSGTGVSDIKVSRSFLEASFTKTFINYLNDLKGLVEELAEK